MLCGLADLAVYEAVCHAIPTRRWTMEQSSLCIRERCAKRTLRVTSPWPKIQFSVLALYLYTFVKDRVTWCYPWPPAPKAYALSAS